MIGHPGDADPIWRRPTLRPLVDSLYNSMDDYPRLRRGLVRFAKVVLGRPGYAPPPEVDPAPVDGPDDLAAVEVQVDGQPAALGHAVLHRLDLAPERVGDARRGFVIDLPGELVDELARSLSLRLSRPENVATAGPMTLAGGLTSAGDTEAHEERGIDALLEAVARQRRLAIVAAYQPFPRLHGYQRELLLGLRRAGFAILLVDSFHHEPDELWSHARTAADGLIVRRNDGWDFRSWYTGLARLGDALDGLDELVLANDSVFGPIFPLAEAFAAMAPRPADFWGVTDSYEIAYHLQSYFLVFRRPAIRSPAFRQFFASPRPTIAKHQAVRHGEIALTQELLRAGLRAESYCSYPTVAAAWLHDLPRRLDSLRPRHKAEHYLAVEGQLRRGQPMNQTHFFWDTLVKDFRCPLLKRDLLLKNPVGVPNLAHLPQLLAERSDYDVALIEEARKHTASPAAPVAG